MFIKVTNDGVLDVPVACNMLGASVKEKQDAIGIFGSGLKYALAQACRTNIPLHVASGDNVFRFTTRVQEFRGKNFDKVILEDIKTGITFDTPITTDFGAHDWCDPWFIYREIVSNALDEAGFRISVVDEIRRCTKETSFYLPYEKFSEIHAEYNKYFCIDESKDDWVKVGTGIMYKHGVRVGQIGGLKLDCNISEVEITETRTIKEYSAFYKIAYLLNQCTDAETWAAFFSSSIANKICINLYYGNEEVIKAFKSGMKKVFSEWAISPDIDNITNDLQAIGVHPFIVPTGWSLPTDKFPSYKDKISLENQNIRNPTTEEEKMVLWGLKMAAALGIRTNAVIKVYSTDRDILGLQDGKVVYLRDDVFKTKKNFLETLFHELGHFESGASDYDRKFADYFVGKMVDFVLS